MADYKDIITGTLNNIVGKVKEVADSGAIKDIYEHGANRAKSYGQMAKLSLEINGDSEELKRVYAEIGRLYYENYRDTADAFLAELCQQVTDANARVAELEAQMDELRAAAKEYRPAPDLHTVDAEVVEPEDIEVEVTEEPAPKE